MSTKRWLLCIAALGLASITWYLTRSRPEPDAGPKVGAAVPVSLPEPAPRASERPAERTEVLADAPSVPEPEPTAPAESPDPERSALARELERVSATFLTTRPAA